MSLVDRINRLVLRRMGRSEVPLAVAGDALRVGRDSHALTDVTDAVAHEVDVHAGTLVALTLSFHGGRTLTVTQEDAGWDDLLVALDRLGLTALPSREWTIAVLAGAASNRPIVLRREGRAST